MLDTKESLDTSSWNLNSDLTVSSRVGNSYLVFKLALLAAASRPQRTRNELLAPISLRGFYRILIMVHM